MGSHCITRGARSGALWQPRGLGCGWSWRGRRFKREGTHVYRWLIHAVVWQKPTQYCKAIILQLKILLKSVGGWGWNLCVVFKLDCKQLQRLYPAGSMGEELPSPYWTWWRPGPCIAGVSHRYWCFCSWSSSSWGLQAPLLRHAYEGRENNLRILSPVHLRILTPLSHLEFASRSSEARGVGVGVDWLWVDKCWNWVMGIWDCTLWVSQFL